MKNHFLVIGCALLALSACSSGPRGPQIQGGPLNDRERARLLPPQGDPGMVAATDFAFAKAAREEGQWTAFRRYAASDAMLHGPDGVTSAAQFLTGLADPEKAVRWGPREIWSSCDGSLSVSFGRFQDPDGIVGSYVTSWKMQSDGDYRWIYDMGAPDVPQPAPPPAPPEARPGENVIVVPAIESIDGKVADCPRDGPRGAAPLSVIADPGQAGAGQSASTRSRDGTLQFRWEHHADGTRRAVVDYLREGEWQQALDFTAPAPEAQ